MAIKILETQVTNEPFGESSSRSAVFAVSDGGEWYQFLVGGLPLADPQAYLESRESEFLAVIRAGGAEKMDPFQRVSTKQLIRAVLTLVVKEINRARVADGLPALTAVQIKNALADELAGLI